MTADKSIFFPDVHGFRQFPLVFTVEDSIHYTQRTSPQRQSANAAPYLPRGGVSFAMELGSARSDLLLALAKLYGVSTEELLKEVKS